MFQSDAGRRGKLFQLLPGAANGNATRAISPAWAKIMQG